MGKKLFVGNLPYSISEEELTDKFSQCGTVDSARVITDQESGRSKGFAFIEMSTDDEARKAIEQFDGSELGGRNMVVNEAKPKQPREGGGFRGRGPRPGGAPRNNRA